MIAFTAWQWLLDALGRVLAEIYDLVPNWGVTIIVLTILIRVVLLPLGIKQVRSMQSMQAIQPKVKQIQQKYKQNKTKQQEEIMKLYREHGVNPFSGCWPVLLQFPILIAMYSVVRFPQHPVHVPETSALYQQISQQIPQVGSPAEVPSEPGDAVGTDFLWMNLLCSASQAGDPDAKLGDRVTFEGDQEATALQYPVDCGDSIPERIPYYLFAAAMFATTYFQQRQMQKASPPGASSQQQQALLRVMPLMFGVFGIFFPAGLVVYWTTSNAWQIGQQYFMLKNRPTAESLAAKADGGKGRKGFFGSMMERATTERQRRDEQGGRPQPGSKPGGQPGKPGSGGGGTGSARSRKKRPKR